MCPQMAIGSCLSDNPFPCMTNVEGEMLAYVSITYQFKRGVKKKQTKSEGTRLLTNTLLVLSTYLIKHFLATSLILKFCLALHKGLNILATASIFTVLLVKNLAAKTNSCICLPLESTTFLPSLLEREREFFPTIRKIIHQSTPTISQHNRKQTLNIQANLSAQRKTNLLPQKRKETLYYSQEKVECERKLHPALQFINSIQDFFVWTF